LRKIENFPKFEYVDVNDAMPNAAAAAAAASPSNHHPKPHNAKFDFNEIVRNRIKNAAVNVASELREMNSASTPSADSKPVTPDQPRSSTTPSGSYDDELEVIEENQHLEVSKRVMSIFFPNFQPMELSRKPQTIPLVPKQYVFASSINDKKQLFCFFRSVILTCTPIFCVVTVSFKLLKYFKALVFLPEFENRRGT